MFESSAEGLGRPILSESKRAAASDARQATGACDQQEAQRAHAPRDIATRSQDVSASIRGDKAERGTQEGSGV